MITNLPQLAKGINGITLTQATDLQDNFFLIKGDLIFQ